MVVVQKSDSVSNDSKPTSPVKKKIVKKVKKIVAKKEESTSPDKPIPLKKKVKKIVPKKKVPTPETKKTSPKQTKSPDAKIVNGTAKSAKIKKMVDSDDSEEEAKPASKKVSPEISANTPNTYPIPEYISATVLAALKSNGISSLFEVQHRTLDESMAGMDLIVQARTGSGKTLAFALPSVERLLQSKIKIRPAQPRILVLAPTRELAGQINKVFNQVTVGSGLSSCAIYGGSSYDQQRRELRNSAIVVATPGRLKDLLSHSSIDLSKVKIVILDEVDRMLDMGFEADVEHILSHCPYPTEKPAEKKADDEDAESKPDDDKRPQTLFYSATCPAWVKKKSTELMNDVKSISLVDSNVNISGSSKLVEHLSVRIDNRESVATCVRDLVRLYSAGRAAGRALVFTQTKQEANDLALGDIAIGDAQVMHGDIEQRQREVTLKGFREGKFRCLIATDVASRGLDIPQIDLVVQTSPPKGSDIESYVHRSGRTGRAGKSGVCVCIYNFRNQRLLKDIERETGVKFRDIPIPQPIDVARSVMKEKLQEDIKAVVSDSKETFENFRDLATELVTMCDDDTNKALACLLTYIAQDGEELNARSMISGKETFQTWLLEVDNFRVTSLMGMLRTVLRRNDIPEDAINQVKTWKEFLEPSSLNGAGIAFDLPSKYTKEILVLWEDGTVKSSGRDQVKLSRCGNELPKMKDWKDKFGQGGRGRGGGGYRGNGGGNRGNWGNSGGNSGGNRGNWGNSGGNRNSGFSSGNQNGGGSTYQQQGAGGGNWNSGGGNKRPASNQQSYFRNDNKRSRQY